MSGRSHEEDSVGGKQEEGVGRMSAVENRKGREWEREERERNGGTGLSVE